MKPRINSVTHSVPIYKGIDFELKFFLLRNLPTILKQRPTHKRETLRRKYIVVFRVPIDAARLRTCKRKKILKLKKSINSKPIFFNTHTNNKVYILKK